MTTGHNDEMRCSRGSFGIGVGFGFGFSFGKWQLAVTTWPTCWPRGGARCVPSCHGRCCCRYCCHCCICKDNQIIFWLPDTDSHSCHMANGCTQQMKSVFLMCHRSKRWLPLGELYLIFFFWEGGIGARGVCYGLYYCL